MKLEELNSVNSVEYEIQRNSLEYGTAVNSDRSIPDAKSGLKPVAKRILYDMYVEGRNSNKPHVKSARVVGDVMGRFHPHGDSSIYGAMIRLSQPWVMRYPLIDIHGNNGTILGDGPAAMRYTESRLSKLSEDGILQNLNKEIVDYIPNYDDTDKEPVTLPAVFPNLLCNPNDGIGWAMGSSWAPHNLKEVAQAIYDYLDNKEPTLPGPDFPTGGLVINKDDIPNIMATGKGSVKIRGQYTIDKQTIIFYEIPYGTSVEGLMEQIGKACDDEKIKEIKEVRNETGKKGLRLVIEGTKNAVIDILVNQLFEYTDLQTNFAYNQVALVGKTPTEMNLKDAIKIYVDHNIECIKKEYEYDLATAKDRLEIVEGLLIALNDIDSVIQTIKSSKSASDAQLTLQQQYNLTSNQTQAIVDMKLARLAKLGQTELEDEKKDLDKKVIDYTKIIDTYKAQVKILIDRLKTIVEEYGDDRRTVLEQITVTKAEKEIKHVEPEKVVVVLTASNNIKRVPIAQFKQQNRNTKGTKIQKDDITTDMIRTNTIDNLIIFSNKGKAYRILVNDIPLGTNTSTGVPVNSLIDMEEGEEPQVIYSVYRDTNFKNIMFMTEQGKIKKMELEGFAKMRKKNGAIIIGLEEGDTLAAAALINDENILCISQKGQLLCLTSDIRASGKTSKGVAGMKLNEGDKVVTMLPLRDNNDELALFLEKGQGKRLNLSDIEPSGRNTKGIKCAPKDNNVNCAVLVNDNDSLLLVGENNSLCLSAANISTIGRTGGGTIMIKDDKVISVTKI